MTKHAARKSSVKKRKSIKTLRKQSYLAKYILAFVFILFSGIFFVAFGIYKRINTEYALAYSSADATVVSEKFFSIAYITVDNIHADTPLIKQTQMLIVDANNSKIVSYDIPISTVSDLPGRFGEEPLSNVIALGKLDSNIMQGIELAESTISKLFGFPVDKYILVNESLSEPVSAIIKGKIDSNLQSLISLDVFLNIKTNFTLKEFIDFYKFASSIPSDRYIVKTFSDSYISNQNLLDDEIQDITFDSKFANEKQSVAILNASGTVNIAGYGARIVRNLGGRVVVTENADNSYTDSFIVAAHADSYTVQRLKEIFNIEKVVLTEDASDLADNAVNRADVTIFLGIDFANAL